MARDESMRKINRVYRKVTGKSSVSGVSLHAKVAAIFEHHNIPIPNTKAGLREMVAPVLGLPVKRHPKKKPEIKKINSDEFYKSWEWKRVRLAALKLNGRRCQCCGWAPGDTDHGYLVVDHIKPRKKYPTLALAISNLQVLCNDCNMGKAGDLEDDYRTFEAKHKASIA